MIYPLSANQHFFRITKARRRWRDVLSGEGALYLRATGNRYNVILQQAAYVSDSLAVAVTEWAYYVARDWQDHIGKHHAFPITGPLLSEAMLWQFTIKTPNYVVDAESLAASLPWPAHVLLNPSGNYAATQYLANLALSRSFPGYTPPHPGLKVPAVRSRLQALASESNFVFFRMGKSPTGQLVGKWRLQIEFLDPAGNEVTAATVRVDWSRFRFRLLQPPGSFPAGQTSPAGYSAASWYPLALNHL